MKKLFLHTCICAVYILTACSSDKKTDKTNEKFPVTFPVVLNTTFTQDYVADIQAIQNVEIRARVKGFLDKIYVDEGAIVKEGQVLFCISNREYQEELLKAKALLKNVIADAKAAELEVRNNKILVEKNIISRTQLEMAQAKWDALLAKIDEAKSNESNATLNLSYTIIRAPFNGVINRIPNKIGSLIDEGAFLTTISNTNEVFAYFHVSEKEYLNMLRENENNQQKNLQLILADGQLYNHPGKIEIVESEIDKNTGNLAFRARFKNPDRLLKHGSSGKIQLINELANAMVIPQKATYEIQEKTYVFVVDRNNVVQSRNILIKQRLPHLFVIESGLTPDDKIIYEGIQRVKEGDKIIPEPVSMAQIMAQQTKL